MLAFPHLVDPRTLDETTVRAMWRLRLRFMRLREEVDPEDDFARYAKVVRSSILALLLRDMEGEVRATMVVGACERSFRGRRFVWVRPEYGFIDPAYRGGALLLLMCGSAIGHCRRLFPDLPAHVVSIAWPSGFIAYNMLADMQILGNPGLPPWEQGMLHMLAEEMGGERWDAEQERMWMPVIPAFPLRRPKRAQALEAYHEYLARNPEWEQGYAAVVSHPVLPNRQAYMRAIKGVVRARFGRR